MPSSMTERFGASVIVREGALEKVARLVGGRCHLIPLCVDGLMVMPESVPRNRALWESMEAGLGMIPEHGLLSTHLYYCELARRTLTRLPDPPGWRSKHEVPGAPRRDRRKD